LNVSFAITRATPGFGCDRQIERPGWFARHETDKFLLGAEILRHFTDNLVVDVKDDRVSGGLNADHRLGKKIASDPADNIFSPKASISACAMAAILELSGGIIREYNKFAATILTGADARLGI